MNLKDEDTRRIVERVAGGVLAISGWNMRWAAVHGLIAADGP